jgi:hypothetical protein
MNKKEICKEIEKSLKLKSGIINENTVASEIENWDSLGQISIIMHLDAKYNDITKDKPEYMTATSVNDFYEAGLKDVDYIQ